MAVSFVFRSQALGQRCAVGPDLLNFIKFIWLLLPFGREPSHDGMIGFDVNHLERTAGLVAIGTDTKDLAPFVCSGFAVAMDRAMDHDRRHTIEMRFGDVLDP